MKNLGRNEVLGAHVANPATSNIGRSMSCGWCTSCEEPCNNIDGCLRCGKDNVITKEYPVSPVEDRITAQFEEFVRSRARLAYMDIERSDPNEADKMRSKYNSEWSAGMYNWDDNDDNTINYVKLALGKPWGAHHLMFLLMVRADKDITKPEAVKILNSLTKEEFIDVYTWALAASGKMKLPTKNPPTNGSSKSKVEPSKEETDVKEPLATFDH